MVASVITYEAELLARLRELRRPAYAFSYVARAIYKTRHQQCIRASLLLIYSTRSVFSWKGESMAEIETCSDADPEPER